MVKEITPKKEVYSLKKTKSNSIEVLLNKGASLKEIGKKLKQLIISKQMVSYWKIHEILETHYRRNDLSRVYEQYIKKLLV